MFGKGWVHKQAGEMEIIRPTGKTWWYCGVAPDENQETARLEAGAMFLRCSMMFTTRSGLGRQLWSAVSVEVVPLSKTQNEAHAELD